jgi:hypothetical protein
VPGTIADLPAQPVQLGEPETGVFTATLTFTADGGPVSYTVSIASEEQSGYGITADPDSATVPAGQQATINITVTMSGSIEPTGPPTITLNPGGIAVQFKFPLIKRIQ